MAVSAELIIKATDKASAVFKIIEKAAKEMEKALSGIKAADAQKTFEDVEKAAKDLSETVDTAAKNTKELDDKFKDAQLSGKDIAESFEKAGKMAEEIGEGFLAIGEKAAEFLGEAINAATEFEKALARSVTASNLTGKAFDELKIHVGELAEKMSVEFGISAEKVLEAFYHVQSMGVNPASKGFEVLSTAGLKLAKIYGLDISDAVRDLGIVLSIFGQDMTTAGHAANVLFGASQMGKTTLQELMKAMNVGGKAADAMGISMEDTAAAMIMFSDKGNMGAGAGTLFRNMLLNMAAPTTKAAKALKELGVDVYDGTLKMKPSEEILKDFEKAFVKLTKLQKIEALKAMGIDALDTAGKVKPMKQVIVEVEKACAEGIPPEFLKAVKDMGVETSNGAGKMRPMWDILKDLKKATSDLSDEERNRLLYAIMGKRAYAAVTEALKGNLDHYEKMATKLKTVSTLDKAMTDNLKTLATQIDRLKAVWQAFMVAVGTPLIQILTPIVTKIVEIAKAVIEWMKHNQELTKSIVIWTAVGAAIMLVVGTLLIGIGGLVTAITGVITGFIALGPLAPAVAGILAGIGVVTAGLTAIITALAAAWITNWGGIRQAVTNAIQFMIPIVVSFIEKVKEIAAVVVAKIAELAPQFTAFFAELWKVISGFVADVYPALENMWNEVLILLGKIWAILEPWMPTLWALVKVGLEVGLTAILVIVKGWVVLFTLAIKGIEVVCRGLGILFDPLIKAVKWAGGILKTVIDGWILIFKGLALAIEKALNAAAAAIDKWTGGKLKFLTESLRKLERLLAKLRGLASQTTSAAASAGANAGADAGGDNSREVALNNGGGGVIIQGNVYGGPSGLRELEGLLSRSTNERLARGAV